MRLLIFALLVLSINGAVSQTLDDYIKIALENNPELKAFSFRASAFEKRIKQAGSLDDPMLTIGTMNLPTDFSFTSDMMTMNIVGITQKLKLPVKYRLLEEIAKRDYKVALMQYEAKKLEIVSEVKKTYFEIYFLERAIDITRKSVDLLRDFVKITSTRFATGQGIQQDVLKAQVELSKMRDRLIKLEGKRRELIAKFNALLYRNPDDTVYIPGKLETFNFNLSFDALRDTAYLNNPLVLAFREVVKKRKAQHQLARKNLIPDFQVRLSYGQRGAVNPITGKKVKDMITFIVGLNLPVYFWRKQNLKIQETEIKFFEAESSLASLKNNISKMLKEAIVDIEKNKDLMKLYKDGLIPQATQNLNIGLVGYQVGKIDFMTLVDNFIALYNYQIQYERSFADYHKKIAEVEFLTGKEILKF